MVSAILQEDYLLMDIYAVENQEGRYLARELEKLRMKRAKGRIDAKCSPANRDKISRYRNAFLLEHGISDVFARADHFYITVERRALALVLVYDVCHISYRLREEIDWKYVELEIIDKAFCEKIAPNKKTIAGLAEVTAFHILAARSITYGFHNAFHPESDRFLYDIFERISNTDELKKAEFGIEAKVTSLIYKIAY